jgi:hypothetical protein
MTNKVISIHELSSNEVNNVSGGLGMPYVLLIEAGQIGIAGYFLGPLGAAIAVGITTVSVAESYFVKNQSLEDSFRCGVYALGTAIPTAAGLRLGELRLRGNQRRA